MTAVFTVGGWGIGEVPAALMLGCAVSPSDFDGETVEVPVGVS